MLALNKKSLKYIIIFFILILFIPAINSFAMVEPTNEFYVNDYANLLNEETKQYIINCNTDLYSKTGAQVVVVTVPNLEGKALEEYSTELFRKFGIGSKEKNNGVLLLLALEERQFRVEVGYGLEGALPDGKTGRIQDEYIIPYLKDNNWNDGIKNGFNAILQVICKEYNVEITNSEQAVSVENEATMIETILPIIIMVIIIIIFSRFRRTTFWGGPFSGGGFGGRKRIITEEAFRVVDSQVEEVLLEDGGSSRGF